MKQNYLLFLFFSTISLSQAQITFNRSYSGGAGYAVNQCYDGGYICAGGSQLGAYCAYLLRTDEYGDTLWERKYTDAGGQNMVGFDVIQTRDSNFIVSGYVNSGQGYGFLLKINQYGDTLWKRYYTTSYHWVQSVAETEDGSLFAGGGSFFKTDSVGNLIWDVNPFGQVMYVLETDDSDIVTVGFDTYNIYLRKYSQSGTVRWSKMYAGTLHNASNNCVAQTTDGGFIITGLPVTTWGTILIRTDSNGDTLWTKNYPEGVWGNAVVETSTGGYAIGAKAPDGQIMLMKTDAAGTLLCIDTLGGSSEGGKSIQMTTDNGFILCGNGSGGLHLVKTDSAGSCLYLGIEAHALMNEMMVISPNPFSEYGILHSSNEVTNATLIIYNSLGVPVRTSGNLSGPEFIISGENLSAGIYIAVLYAGSLNEHLKQQRCTFMIAN